MNDNADVPLSAKVYKTKLAARSLDETIRSLRQVGRDYQILYVDVAWPFSGGGNRSVRRHYPTMTIDEIKALPVASLAADDCVLFLWATYPQLPKALEVISAWGFEYKGEGFTWMKTNKRNGKLVVGLGYWTRSNAEVCLLATRGRPKRIDAGVSSAVTAPRGRHSEKPDEVRRRIVRLMGDVPRIELFARQHAPGWDAWGNEVQRLPPGSGKILDDLRIWIEDTEELKAWRHRRGYDPLGLPAGYTGSVENVQRFGHGALHDVPAAAAL